MILNSTPAAVQMSSGRLVPAQPLSQTPSVTRSTESRVPLDPQYSELWSKDRAGTRSDGTLAAGVGKISGLGPAHARRPPRRLRAGARRGHVTRAGHGGSHWRRRWNAESLRVLSLTFQVRIGKVNADSTRHTPAGPGRRTPAGLDGMAARPGGAAKRRLTRSELGRIRVMRDSFVRKNK